jgi:hypothetical protein
MRFSITAESGKLLQPHAYVTHAALEPEKH